MQTLWMFSVPIPSKLGGGILNAIVPETLYSMALRRLRADDPLWESRDINCHGRHVVFEEVYRVRMRNKIKFWRTLKYYPTAPAGRR